MWRCSAVAITVNSIWDIQDERKQTEIYTVYPPKKKEESGFCAVFYMVIFKCSWWYFFWDDLEGNCHISYGLTICDWWTPCCSKWLLLIILIMLLIGLIIGIKLGRLLKTVHNSLKTHLQWKCIRIMGDCCMYWQCFFIVDHSKLSIRTVINSQAIIRFSRLLWFLHTHAY